MALWGFGWTFRSGAEDAWLADETGAQGLGRAYQRGAQVGRLAGLAGIGSAVALASADLRLPLLCAGGRRRARWASSWRSRCPSTGSPPGARQRRGRVGARGTAHGGGRPACGGRPPGAPAGARHLARLGAWSEGFDRLWEAHLLLDVGLPGAVRARRRGVVRRARRRDAGALLRRRRTARGSVERLRPRRLVRLLLLLHALLVVAVLVFALAGRCGSRSAPTRHDGGALLTARPTGPGSTCSITDSSSRATVLSITNLADSAGQWGGGPALGWVGTRWAVRTALAAGALCLLPAVVLLGRAARRDRVGAGLVTPGAATSRG